MHGWHPRSWAVWSISSLKGFDVRRERIRFLLIVVTSPGVLPRPPFHATGPLLRPSGCLEHRFRAGHLRLRLRQKGVYGPLNLSETVPQLIDSFETAEPILNDQLEALNG